MPTRLMQRNNIVNGFVLVNDEATDKALAQAKAEVGDADWKKGYSKESQDIARAALKEHGARYETELKGKLTRVELAETHANGTAFKKMRVTLESDNGDRTILSTDLNSEFAQRLAAKLDAASKEPGQVVTIGGFAEQVDRDGKTFANHVATMKDANGQEIKAEQHFDKAQEAVKAAQAPMVTAGMGDNKEVMNKIADGAREKYFAGVVQEISGRFPEREQTQRQELPRMEAHLKSEQGPWHSVGVYVDQEGKARGSLRINDQEQGIDERHKLEFRERTSQSGIPMLAASVTRDDGSKLYVNILPGENGQTGEKFLSATFGEKGPEQGAEFQRIEGKGGSLKPNEAMLKLGDKDRTVQFVQEKLGVNVLENARAKGQSQEKAAAGVER